MENKEEKRKLKTGQLSPLKQLHRVTRPKVNKAKGQGRQRNLKLKLERGMNQRKKSHLKRMMNVWKLN